MIDSSPSANAGAPHAGTIALAIEIADRGPGRAVVAGVLVFRGSALEERVAHPHSTFARPVP
jgi:hypothetical protein